MVASWTALGFVDTDMVESTEGSMRARRAGVVRGERRRAEGEQGGVARAKGRVRAPWAVGGALARVQKFYFCGGSRGVPVLLVPGGASQR